MSRDKLSLGTEDWVDVEYPADDEEKESEKDFTPQKLEEFISRSVENYFKNCERIAELKKAKEEIRERLIEKYFPDGIPTDLPYHLRKFFNVDSEDVIYNPSESSVKEVQNTVTKIGIRQTEIMGYFLDKTKYLSRVQDGSIGNFVDEYKKLENLKHSLLDRLQASYNGQFGFRFNSIFTEDNHGCCNRH